MFCNNFQEIIIQLNQAENILCFTFFLIQPINNLEITEEEGQETGNYSRKERDKRESIVTVASYDHEREYLQRNRDISVTFGFREGGSTQDLR